MDVKANDFVQSATVAIHDITLQTALDRGTAELVSFVRPRDLEG